MKPGQAKGGVPLGATPAPGGPAAPGAAPTSNANAWLLHPAVPVDVRLVAVTALAGGAGYIVTREGEQEKQKKLERDLDLDRFQPPGRTPPAAADPAPALDADTSSSDLVGTDCGLHLEAEGAEGEPAVAAAAEAEAAEAAEDEPQAEPGRAAEAAAAPERPAEDGEPAAALAAVAAGPAEPAGEGPAAEPADEAPVVITEDEMKAVAALLTEAVTGLEPPAEFSVEDEHAMQLGEEAEEGAAEGSAAPAEEDPGLTMPALADLEAEAVNEVLEAVAAAEQSAEPPAEPPAEPTAEPPAAALREVAGVNLAPEALVAKALREGEDPGENWALYGAMHRQAISDARAFEAAIAAAETQYRVSRAGRPFSLPFPRPPGPHSPLQHPPLLRRPFQRPRPQSSGSGGTLLGPFNQWETSGRGSRAAAAALPGL